MTKKNGKNRLVVIGAGGHGRAVAEAAQMVGKWQQIVFLDDGFPNVGNTLNWPVLGKAAGFANTLDNVDECIIAIGNQSVRERLFHELTDAGVRLASVVHPRAWVSPNASVERGVAVMAGAVVGCMARIGCGAIINANSTVDHDAVLEDFAHIGVGVQLAGGVVVRKSAWLQAGCSAGYRVVVPEQAVVPPGTALMEA